MSFTGIFQDVFDVDLSYLFIVRVPPHKVQLDPDSNSKR
jgi:hypothetical protein